VPRSFPKVLRLALKICVHVLWLFFPDYLGKSHCLCGTKPLPMQLHHMNIQMNANMYACSVCTCKRVRRMVMISGPTPFHQINAAIGPYLICKWSCIPPFTKLVQQHLYLAIPPSSLIGVWLLLCSSFFPHLRNAAVLCMRQLINYLSFGHY